MTLITFKCVSIIFFVPCALCDSVRVLENHTIKAVTRVDPGDLTIETLDPHFTPPQSTVRKLSNRAMIFSEFGDGITHTFRVTNNAGVTLFTLRKHKFCITEIYQKKMLIFNKDEGDPSAAQAMPFYILQFDEDNDADLYGGFLLVYSENGETIPLPQFCTPFLRLLKTRSVNELINWASTSNRSCNYLA